MKSTNYLTVIQKKLDTFTFTQLNILFHIIFHLNCQCNFFMSEQTHTIFIDRYFDSPSIRTLETFKIYISYSIIKYVSPSKFPDILKTIKLIENDTPFEKIIDTLYSPLKVS